VLAALVIVFREVFEAGLIVGIVLAVTRGVAHRERWVAGGVLAGVAGACLVAAFAGGLSLCSKAWARSYSMPPSSGSPL